MLNRFLVFSDLHLHQWSYGSNYKDGWNSRLMAQWKAMMQMVDYATENDIKQLVFCGDLFHTHHVVHARPLSLANSMMDVWAGRGLKCLFLVGNHDIAGNDPTMNTLGLVRGYGHELVMEERSFDIDGMVFHCLPYLQPGEETRLNSFIEDATVDSIMLMHQGVKNVGVGSKSFIISDEIFDHTLVPDHIFHCFTGHYHSHKHVSNRVTVVGSPMQHTWSDVGETRGFLDVTINPKSIVHVPLESPEFKRIDMGSTSGWTDNLDNLVKNNFVKFANLDPQVSMAEWGAECFQKGARCVEFELPDAGLVDIKATQAEIFNLPKLVERYIDENEIEIDSATTGGQLMNKRYEFDADPTS